MRLLIDGHNLIGRLPDIRLEDPDDEARLVSRLQAYAGRTGQRVTVVFDRGMPGGRSANLSGGLVKVVFAPTGRSADGVLIERVGRTPNPQGLLLVTSDREVIAAAEGRGVRVMRAEAFATELEAPTVSTGPKEDGHVSPEEVEEWLARFGDAGEG
ncbi:MAG: NYN domain-containing protein [Chloroflexota bacterium]